MIMTTSITSILTLPPGMLYVIVSTAVPEDVTILTRKVWFPGGLLSYEMKAGRRPRAQLIINHLK